MAENVNLPSSHKTSEFKNLIIGILTALLITGGLVATFSDYLKDVFVNNTKFYTCNLILKNGPDGNLPGIKVKLKTPSGESSDSTDIYGNVIFKVKKKVHKISFFIWK